MSVKYKVVLTLVICSFSKVFLTGCVVLFSVSRNITDSFRIGIHGCTRNSSICTPSSTCQPDGSCLCPATSPARKTFRSPIIGFRNGTTFNADHDSYGCNHDIMMIAPCKFSPFQVVPYSQGYPEIVVSYVGKSGHTVGNCSLRQTLVKFPDKTEEIEVKWLDESYIDLRISNNNVYFKWKKTVQRFQGTIITLNLNCTVNSIPTTECLRAKIFGKWSANMNSSIKETSTKPTISDVRSNANKIATQKTLVLSSPTGRMQVNESDSSIRFTALDTSSIKDSSTKPSRPTTFYFWSKINKKTSQKTLVRSSPTGQMPRSDRHGSRNTTHASKEPSTKTSRPTTSDFRTKTNRRTSPCLLNVAEPGGSDSNTILIVVLAVSVVLNVVLGIVTGFLCGKNHRNQIKKRNAEDQIIQMYEESKYQPLQRNHLQNQIEEHTYQGLATLHKGNQPHLY